MSSLHAQADSEYTGKRAKLLSEIAGDKWKAKQLEQILSSLRGRGKTEELFSLPASSINQRYGLITIENEMPPYDRFGSIEIPEATLRTIYALITSDVLYSSEFQPPSADGEMQLSPILDRMTRNLGRFTKPRQMGSAVAANEDAAKKSDFVMKYPEEPAEPVPQAAADWDSSDEEDMPQGASMADVLVYVFKELHTMHGLRLKLAKDWKGNLFQPAVYVVDELRETRMKPKGYRPPVYILAEDKDRWYYGILEIDGFVKIKNQAIVVESLEDVSDQGNAPRNAKFTRSDSREEVSSQLEVWKRTMLLEDMEVPDGFHPVGRFFIRSLESFETPSMFADRPIGTGAMRYLDGMLKILVGRRKVINWTPEDAVKAWGARKFLEKKARVAAGLPADVWPQLHPEM